MGSSTATAAAAAMPPPLGVASAADVPCLRGFHDPSDLLALDLRRPADAGLITDVLAYGAGNGDEVPVPAEHLWDLSVGRRLLGLLRIAEAHGLGAVELPFQCPRAGCGAVIAVTLTPAELAVLGDGSDDTPVEVALDDGVLRLRRPTGRDQQRWAAKPPQPNREAASVIVADLLLDGPQRRLTAAELAQAEAALDAADPLVRAAVQVRCPACGGLAERELDIAAIVLDRLRCIQAELLDAIHRLAQHYHWREADILALPAWRRTHYLGLIAREAMIR